MGYTRLEPAWTAHGNAAPAIGEVVVLFASQFFGAVFLGLPPVLLAARFFWRKPPWWVIVLLVIVVGWASWFLAVATHFEELWERVGSTDTPDPELVEQASADGGPLVFAAFLGWAISLAYAGPWFVLFLMATGLRSLIRRFRRGER